MTWPALGTGSHFSGAPTPVLRQVALPQPEAALVNGRVYRRLVPLVGDPGVMPEPNPQARRAPTCKWTHKVDGKTTKLLTADQRDRYQDWFDNDRKLKDLSNQLETLSPTTLTETEG